MKSISDNFEIYKYKFKNLEEKRERLKKLFFETKPIIVGNVLTNFETSYETKQLMINEIYNLFDHEINCFRRDVCGEKYEISSAWMQEYKKDMNHHIHDHGYGYSAIIYLKYNKKIHPSTVFLDKKTYLSENIFKPEVEEGDIIFFNSKHYHHCPTNENDKERMICSFNLKKDIKISYA